MPRRRPGSLLPLEISILAACQSAGSTGTHGFAIAQTIVDLGIDVGEIQTTANMRDALSGSFSSMGVRLRGGD